MTYWWLLNMNFSRKKEPELRCVNLDPAGWQKQCLEFESRLKINSATTLIVSIKDLVTKDPIAAMNALQKINSVVKINPSHKIAALSKDMLLITPFTLHMAE